MSFSHSLKDRTGEIWEAGYRHPFVQGLGSGTLPREAFQFYLAQDYLYLLEYTRIFAIGAAKADTEALMGKFTLAQNNIINGEMDLHRAYMEKFGIDRAAFSKVRPSLFNRAYTGNMLSTAYAGGPAEILATIFPCAWTYYDYATRLAEDYGTVPENPYQSWIDMYSSADFEDSFLWFYDELDRLCQGKSEAELDLLAEIFTASVESEYLFWEMGYRQNMGV